MQNACSLLGYGKGELEAKNINLIMPPPYSQRHNRYLRQYVQTGRERVMSSVNTVLALHKARYVLPVKLAVSKVSGATEGGYTFRLVAQSGLTPPPCSIAPHEASRPVQAHPVGYCLQRITAFLTTLLPSSLLDFP